MFAPESPKFGAIVRKSRGNVLNRRRLVRYLSIDLFLNPIDLPPCSLV
jgi:hypothetical protein